MTSPAEAATPALKHVRPGLLHVLALAHTLMLRTWARGTRDRRKIVRLGVELERCRNELVTEREKFRLVSARMARVPAAERPRYTPFERMAILELHAAFLDGRKHLPVVELRQAA